ncbi:hypothetical protein N7478_001487 [Penicillium angulare]|uniref:uncharacterized protein n=1 Tax=Penicillium angulare TaxID=116970 RepID=UPI00253FEE13|nr:uncharacterized protein N7478_010744 [Penicillium angulare]XP_056785582.1 uncharacterized protein N7478_001487 [Penicillium angulare]KAJ5267936.1 hypothetical protein N7478_010744 [Penicillium angulare]KAJ5292236.1 hypothetical protein N7478_001487 [Penicillium angulare]
MTASESTLATQSKSRKLARQKRCRRRAGLIKKVLEYSALCHADVCVGIRIRETGEVHIVSADEPGFWDFVSHQMASHFPRVILTSHRKSRLNDSPSTGKKETTTVGKDAPASSFNHKEKQCKDCKVERSR